MRWDAVIVGSGVAGGAAAAQLAREGQKVLLLEKESMAHHKVCGEFISIEAQHHLAALGIDPLMLGAERIDHVRLVRGGQMASAALPFRAMSLSRKTLDENLLASAQSSGAAVRRGTTVAGVAGDGSGWRVTLADGENIAAPAVFLASGKHDVRGWSRPGGSQNDYIGFKMHYALTPLQRARLAGHVEIFLFDGGYAGLEPVENGIANLCLVVTKARFGRCGKNWQSLLRFITRATPLLAERLESAAAAWEKPLSVFGIPYGYVYRPSPAAPTGLYRLGDQMAVIPSIFGDGIAIALHTASAAVAHHLRGNSHVYHARMREELMPQLRRASLVARVIAIPSAQRLAVTACRFMPRLMPALAARTRIAA